MPIANDKQLRQHKVIDTATFKVTDKDSGYDKEVLIKKVRLPNGVIENFFVTKDRDSVQILPVDSERRVYLVRQWRSGEEKECLEVSGGGLDGKNEDPSVAALRELEEETGLSTDKDNLIHLATVSYNPYSTGKRHLFLAKDCYRKNKELDLDANEFLKVEKYSLEDVRELIKKGTIRGADLIYMAFDKLDLL